MNDNGVNRLTKGGKMKPLQLVVTTVISVVASFSLVFAFFAFFMNFLLNAKIEPMKKDIVHLAKRIDNLEVGQNQLVKRIDSIEVKLDKLLAKP